MTQTQNLLVLLIISTLFLISSHYVSAQPYKSLVAPITKDTTTSLYSITLNYYEKYVIDLGGPFLWYHCPKNYPKVSCSSPRCIRAQSYHSPLCPTFNNTSKNKCTCVVTPSNPITKMCSLAELTQKDLINSWTDGRTPTIDINFNHFYVACAHRSLLSSLPKGTYGMAGFSRSSLSVSMQLTPQYRNIKRQFSLCLPSNDAAPGVAFFGEGPFNMIPSTDFDVRSILTYTPLRKNSKSPDYYIDLKAVSINGKRCHFLARVLEFDSLGRGGAKLSTVHPYAKLRSHIYRPFIMEFAKATRHIPRAKKVKPFDYCLNTSSLGSTRLGLPVPQIDLELVNGKNWTIFGSNSMKQVSHDVACLAVVDGGERAEEAVVLGAFQMENNFLLFDVKEGKLGFSSSLFSVRTTCSNFNFTSKG